MFLFCYCDIVHFKTGRRWVEYSSEFTNGILIQTTVSACMAPLTIIQVKHLPASSLPLTSYVKLCLNNNVTMLSFYIIYYTSSS